MKNELDEQIGVLSLLDQTFMMKRSLKEKRSMYQSIYVPILDYSIAFGNQKKKEIEQLQWVSQVVWVIGQEVHTSVSY